MPKPLEPITSNNQTVGDLTEDMIQFQQAGLSPRLGFWEGLGTQMEADLATSRFTRKVGDIFMTNYLETQKSELLTPEQVEERYGFKSDEALQDNVASYLWAKRQEKERYNKVLNYVDSDNFVWKASSLLTSIATSFVDPIEFATFRLLGAGVGKGLDTAGKLAGGTFAHELARESITAVAESAMEVPLNFYSSEKTKEEYTVGDASIDVGLNLLFGAGAAVLGHAFKSRGDGEGHIRKTPLDNHNKVEKAEIADLADGHIQNGVKPDYRMYEQHMANLGFQTRKGQVEYKYQKVGKENLSNVPFYGSFNSAGNFKYENMNFYGRNYGKGLILTDNVNLANNKASSAISGSSGSVSEFNIATKNLLDMDQPLPPEIKDNIRKVLNEKDVDINLDEKTGKDVLDGLDNQSFIDNSTYSQDVFNDAVKSQGYDGYLFSESIGDKTHNAAFLFEPDKAQPSRSFRAMEPEVKSPDADIKDSTKKMIEYANDKRNEPDYIPEFDEFDNAKPIIETADSDIVLDAQKQIDDALNGLNEISKYTDIDPQTSKSIKKLVEEVREAMTGDLSPDKFRSLARAAQQCNGL